MAALPLIPALAHAQVDVGVSYSTDGSGLSGMDGLVAPIALYPDPLLGIILPAATAPNDLQAAAGAGGADDQNWQPAVQDLTHYPDVLQWMASNMDWTQQLGAAFANNPSDVMNAIQDLRQRAMADGALQTNGQWVVVNGGGGIQILPRASDVMYVPQYDPNAVFFGHGGVSITFGAALPCGDWLGFYPSWGDHAIWSGDFYAYSRGHGGWAAAAQRGGFFHASGFRGSQWHVAANAQIRNVHVNINRGQAFARPTPMGQRGSSQAYQPAAQRGDERYAQASQARSNPERYNAAAPQRPAQAPAADQRYAQANASRYNESAPARTAAPSDQRYAQSRPAQAPAAGQRYAESRTAEPSRSDRTAAAPAEHPATFAGDSARTERGSAAGVTAKPSTRAQKAPAKTEKKPAADDRSSDKDRQP